MAELNENKTPTEEIKKPEKTPEQKKKSKRRKKMIFNIALVASLTVLSLWLTVGNSFPEISKLMENIFLCRDGCHWKYLLWMLGVIVASVLLRSIVLYFFARLYTRKYHLHQAIAVDQIGIFYSAVTPGDTGGQVMQAYTYKKQGIPISSAISMLAMYSILFQIVLIIYGTISFIVKYDAINSIGAVPLNIGFGEFDLPIWPLTIIGFLLNVGVIGIVLMMGYWKGFHNFIMGPCVSLFHKMHLCKNPDKTRENLRVQVENFKIEMRRIYSNIPFALLICFVFAIYITVKYSSPYFVGQALGNESECANFFDAVFLSNYHQMVTGLVPIPGAAGASELFFKLLFVSNNPSPTNSFYYKAGEGKSEELAKAALLIWRSLTFIIPLIVAGLVAAFYHGSPKDEVTEEGKIPNHQTFISLSSATYDERKAELETMVETSRLTRQEIMKRLKHFAKPTIKKKKKPENNNPQPKEKHIDDVDIDVEDDSL